jgi:hypothetical protein
MKLLSIATYELLGSVEVLERLNVDDGGDFLGVDFNAMFRHNEFK